MAQAEEQAAAATDAPVHFARQILPILSDKCFVCHGPDAPRDGTLRLDSYEAATEQLAIDPDDLASSELIARIHSSDDPMPPADADKQLSDEERDLLTRWVQQGGEYEQHWAYVAPLKADLDGKALPPEAAIDAFVRAKLAPLDADLSEPADRATLARRAALVLTGLPPEPEPLQRFLADDSDAAYDRLLDELFESPRFGEHQARYWLDAVRYGDTHGLHLDNRRGIYPYRDWVVRAFNQNLPLDDFITWQLAGDLLPNPTLEQLTATGFVRMNPTTGEGGAIAAEFQAKNNFDRTETLGTVMLGMSLNCARCHTHKYDPIPHREYYSLLAFFNSTAEGALDGNSYTYGDTAKVPSDQRGWDLWDAMETSRKELLERARLHFSEATADAALLERAKQHRLSAASWQISEVVEETAAIPPGAAWRTTDDPHSVLKPQPLKQDSAIWLTRTFTTTKPQRLWLNFSGSPGSQVWLNGQPVALSRAASLENGFAELPLDVSSGEQTVKLKIVSKVEKLTLQVSLDSAWNAVVDAGHWDALSEVNRLRILADPSGPLGPDGPLRELDKGADDGIQQALAVNHYRLTAERDFTTTLVARDLPKPRETYVLKRGEYDMPVGEPLQPGVLSVLGGFPGDAPRNRRGLADWLTAREHPLVARVLVNRMWQRIFGHGLVRTPEDFGLQGQQPTHPELLDWLSVELHDSGWDHKHMLRLMVSSDTFRQSSRWRDDVDDPENRLWARGPSYRLDAEVIRDLGLWASNLLDPHLGGEGVKPYQPEGMWKALAHPASNTKQYQRDQGERLYRRSLYVYWKRTSPHPMMTLFDAPDRESSCVRRSRTNTSLQSLGLFNETQRVEMGRKLAERLLRDADATSARLDRLFTLIASRLPTAQERSACESLLQQMRDRYAENEADALALIAIGDSPRDETLAANELAAWTQVCITVLASDLALLLY